MLYQLSYASSSAFAIAPANPPGNPSGGRFVRGHTPAFRVHGTEHKVSTPQHREQTREESQKNRLECDRSCPRPSLPARLKPASAGSHRFRASAASPPLISQNDLPFF